MHLKIFLSGCPHIPSISQDILHLDTDMHTTIGTNVDTDANKVASIGKSKDTE